MPQGKFNGTILHLCKRYVRRVQKEDQASQIVKCFESKTN